MYILKNAIIDVPINKELEIDLIQCFMEKDDYVFICSYDYVDEEIQYFRKLKEKHGVSIEISNNLNSEIMYGKKPCVYEEINHYSPWLKKNIVRRCRWYNAHSKKEIESIIYDIENTITYKLRIASDEQNPNDYKYELHMFEHYFIDDDESQEVRSLCFEAGEACSISNRVIVNVKNIILKYNLEE